MVTSYCCILKACAAKSGRRGSCSKFLVLEHHECAFQFPHVLRKELELLLAAAPSPTALILSFPEARTATTATVSTSSMFYDGTLILSYFPNPPLDSCPIHGLDSLHG
jgi:hypothetical protein